MNNTAEVLAMELDILWGFVLSSGSASEGGFNVLQQSTPTSHLQPTQPNHTSLLHPMLQNL